MYTVVGVWHYRSMSVCKTGTDNNLHTAVWVVLDGIGFTIDRALIDRMVSDLRATGEAHYGWVTLTLENGS